uniref:F-box and FNIP repeat-containing protein n=1 Tax=viral metagenome TaxID=1070528 RepID=A0A6C0C8E2_9ZZZZ
MLIFVCEDIMITVAEYLDNWEKIRLSATSKLLDGLKHKFMFRNYVILTEKIEQLPYFDNFMSIGLPYVPNHCPKFAEYVSFFAKTSDIPSYVTHLYFDDEFNQPIKGCIPNSVTEVTFGNIFDQPIDGCIPNSVTKLVFGDRFNRHIKGYIPNSVTELVFGWSFDRYIYIDDYIPPSVIKLTLEKWDAYVEYIPTTIFDLSIRGDIFGTIPLSITHLTYDCWLRFTKFTIPRSVTHLVFGPNFNYDVKNWIPDSVTHLTFGERYNQKIKNSIPKSVTHLTFGRYFSRSVNRVPSSVLVIKLSKTYNHPIKDHLASKIIRY